jgi:predicted nucleic acid-binding protein
VAEYVLDTSAILAYLYDEQGADEAELLIFGQDEVLIPFIALMEVEYKLLQELRDSNEVRERMATLANWPLEPVESDPAWRSAAARVKSQGKISVADAWVAALAVLRDAFLVHKDPEFDSVMNLNHKRLPYTPRQPRRTS